eukprot:jgi/Hompol1/1091/HPOL_005508-RA
MPTTGGQQSADPRYDIRSCAAANDWALTYDDGPSPDTGRLLDDLAQRNIKATFFIVGSRVAANANFLQRAYKEGHLIGIHTWSHPHLPTIPPENVLSEILYAARAIRQVIGVTPTIFRPPYGEMDERVRWIIRRLGMTPALWNVDTKDGDSKEAALNGPNVIRAAINGTRFGMVSLNHDLWGYQVDQHPTIQDLVIAAKFDVKRLDVCTMLTPYDEGVWSGSPRSAQNPPPAPAGLPPFVHESNVTLPSITGNATLPSPTTTTTTATATGAAMDAALPRFWMIATFIAAAGFALL